MTSPINTLKEAISDFAIRNPDSIIVFNDGQRVIQEGAESTDFFLVQQGSLSILVKSPPDGQEKEVALRFEGDMIGETAILQRRARRNASVVVVSPKASLVRLSRQDVLALIKRGDTSVGDAIIALWELAAARRAETQKVLDDEVRVENKVMSVLMGDIHDFSLLGEIVSDVLSESFTFEFLEMSQQICRDFDGLFESQGDGFKIIFEGRNHVGRAVGCAAKLRDSFLPLRTKWARHSASFANIGIGIGVCTDCMSIRRRAGSPQATGQVASHAMSIAAAISKHKNSPSDVDVYLDDATTSLLRTNEFSTEGPSDVWLDRLGRKYSLHRLRMNDQQSYSSALDHSEIPAGRRISILFAASDPKDEARLRLGEEVREIQEQLRLSRYRERFSFHQSHALRPRDLSQALLDHAPQIVHFSGHGTGSKGLCFEGPDGHSFVVGSDALSGLFKEFSSVVKCVVLNACYSEVQATAIAHHVACVIGMSDQISDSAAIAFATGFYQALGAGKQFKDAYLLGRAQIGLESHDESQLPIIKIR